MKKRFMIITLAIAVIAALAFAGLAYAQDTTPTTPAIPWGGRGSGHGMMGGAGNTGGAGMMGGYRGAARGSGTGPMHTYMVEAYAEALGLTVEEVQDQFEAGKTMWQVAADQGLSDEEVQSVMIEARTAALNAMVADGVLTQEQADLMLQRMNTMMSNGFTPGNCPMNGGAGAGLRGGRGGGRWAQPATP